MSMTWERLYEAEYTRRHALRKALADIKTLSSYDGRSMREEAIAQIAQEALEDDMASATRHQ